MVHSGHSFHHLLPPFRPYVNLGIRGHSYQLPECSSDLHKNITLYTQCILSYDCVSYILYHISTYLLTYLLTMTHFYQNNAVNPPQNLSQSFHLKGV